MASAHMTLAAEMNNRKKRDVAQVSAAAIGVCLDMETQRKFMEMASNLKLLGEVDHLIQFWAAP